jgi:tRNA pseudouridine38-40 synthase
MADPDGKRRRFLLTVAYDGRNFEGWQSQAGGHTVQDSLVAALRTVCPGAGKVHGSGRTDAGVSALAQRAHFDVPASASLDGGAWQRALNSQLPPQIRIMECEAVERDFHARYDATGKTYRYRLFLGEVLPPLQHGLAWPVKGKLDRGKLQEAVGLFVGRHDFRAFSANRGDGHDKTRNTERTIRSADLVETSEAQMIDLRISGDGFLYKMVRFIVGSAVRCAQGKLEGGEIERLLAGQDLSEKAPFCAPPDGLVLEAVEYARMSCEEGCRL